MAGRHGGARKGAGKPKGYQHAATITANEQKQIARQVTRDLVLAELQPVTKAQIAHAQGVSYMVLRHPDGSFARATDEKQIDAACAIGASAFKIFTQAPNTQAYVALMDRAFDKPTEHHEHSGEGGGPLVMTITDRLLRARKRAPAGA